MVVPPPVHRKVALPSDDLVYQRLADTFRELYDEKIAAVGASAAASLAALKELMHQQNASNAAAIAKAEAATSMELSGLERSINGVRDAIIAEINNLKQRVDRQEGITLGIGEARKETHTSIGSVVGVVGGVTGVAGVLISLMLGFHVGTTAQNPTVGADTKRVDDMIAQNISRERAVDSRLDDMSTRISGMADLLAIQGRGVIRSPPASSLGQSQP